MNQSGNLRDKPIIMLSMSRWDGVSSASLSLAKEFARYNRVFYIDNPYTIRDLFSARKKEEIRIRKDALLARKNIYRRIEGHPEHLIVVIPALTIPINWLNRGVLYKFLNWINNQILNKTIYRILQDHQITNYILFNSFNPFYGKFISKAKSPLLRIYQSRDNIAAAPYIKKHGVYQEIRQIRNAHFTFATSRRLVKSLSQSSGCKIYYLPNAADISLFTQVVEKDFSKPEELKEIKTKIIGYLGNVGVRLDYELIKTISEKHSDKTILFVGPDESSTYASYKLSRLPNLVSIGKRKLNELPKYLKFIDCAIIPFKIDELTKSIYPLKINEYLASGKPVVSTNFSEDVGEFRSYISIANTHCEFIEMIETSLNKDNSVDQTARVIFAKKNDWSKRVDQFWNIIEKRSKYETNRKDG